MTQKEKKKRKKIKLRRKEDCAQRALFLPCACEKKTCKANFTSQKERERMRKREGTRGERKKDGRLTCELPSSLPSRSSVSMMKPVANDVGVSGGNHTLFLEQESQMKTQTTYWIVNSRDDHHNNFSLESGTTGLLSEAACSTSEVSHFA